MTTLAPYGWWLDGHPAASGVFVTSQPVVTAGKYYWEVTIATGGGGADGTGGYGILFGIAGLGMVLTGTVCTSVNLPQGNSRYGNFCHSRANNPFSGASGWGYPLRVGGIPVEAVGTTAVYAVAVNTLTHKVWFRNLTDASPAAGLWGGGSGSGNPATDADGGLFTAAGNSPILTNIYAMVGASHGAAAARGGGSINFGASAFTGTVPSGFVSIESVFPGAALNPSDNSNLTLSGGNLVFDGTSVPVAFSPRPPDVAFDTNVGYSNSCRSRFCIAQGP